MCRQDGHPATISLEWQGHTWGGRGGERRGGRAVAEKEGEGVGREGSSREGTVCVSPYTHPLSFFAAILKMMAGLLVVSMCALASWA